MIIPQIDDYGRNCTAPHFSQVRAGFIESDFTCVAIPRRRSVDERPSERPRSGSHCGR